jgi:hypothetical protein
MNNLVESYIQMNPKKKRTEDEMKQADANDKIDERLKATGTIKLRENEEDDYDDYDDEYNSDEYNSEDDYSRPRRSFFPLFNYNAHCRECTVQGADGHQCNVNTTHVACSACYQVMPQRTDLPANRPQKCKYFTNYAKVIRYILRSVLL